jgi:hypothetical protein
MIKGLLVLTIGIGLAVGAMSAVHDERHESVKVLAARDIAEKLDGKDAKATAVEVTLEPGQASDAHRHPGPRNRARPQQVDEALSRLRAARWPDRTSPRAASLISSHRATEAAGSRRSSAFRSNQLT